MLKLSICHARLESIYGSYTGSSSENICSSSGGAQEKGGQYETESTTKIDGFKNFTPALES